MQQKLADYRRPAPELSWDEIDKVLEARQSRPLWVRRLAAAAVLLLIAGAGYLAFHQKEAAPEQPPVTVAHHPQQPEQQTKALVQQTVAEVSSERPRRATSRMMEPSVESVSEDTVATVQAEVVATSAAEEMDAPSVTESKTSPAVSRPKVVYPADLHRQPTRTGSRLMAKVYMSNTMGNSRRSESSVRPYIETIIKNSTIYLSSSNDDDPNPRDGGEYDNEGTSGGGENVINEHGPHMVPLTVYDTISTVKWEQTDHYVHHRQPVRFGLSLRCRIGDRWSVESGLTYTRLSSDITTLTNGVSTTEEQRLNYIGVPLNVGYQLWGNRRFSVYVLAGGIVEKMLDASPWQFSLNGAAGVEYMFNRQFSIYAEPGFGYYFPDGSSIPTIYQDRRLNLNLGFGLRMNL